ncbi:GNAT family N-acetyltransferase [Spirosoma arcticum]
MLQFLSRSEVDTVAWDACVTASSERILYGYAWYLDAVASSGAWCWVGLVLMGEADAYRAVMPVPLRRKQGIWVVHQPLFCQFLDVFSPDKTLDSTPFLEALQQRYRYGSVLNVRPCPHPSLNFDLVRQRATHVLDLSVSYEAIARHYTHDRKLNLRRAINYGWTIIDSTDPEPLLTLFRDHHANSIDGGVGEWAYATLRRLIQALQQRGLATLQYALRNGQIEAGALFVQEGNRIIYLFNAASETGRRGNARTLLIDQFIRANSGKPVLFDFESPPKESIVNFYLSFGAVEAAFREVRWSRLTLVERGIKALLTLFG